MAYRVEIARRAEADLEELYLWVVDRAPQQGARWFSGLERAVLSLDQHPKRCPVAPESFDPDHPVRTVDEVVREALQVLQARDEARRRLRADIDQPAHGEGRAYDDSGRQLAQRIKLRGRAALKKS